MRRKLLWTAAGFVVAAAIITIGGALYARHELRGSLPILDGAIAFPGLSAAATIERDALGVPTVTAATRADAARALGFVHAQERFFQMDLQRRQAAGELSALVGARAVEADRTMRVHRFRHIAEDAIARTSPAYRELLNAYAAGVNAGLNALNAPPFEYLMLRVDPEPWKPEDTILTVLAMFNTLQGRQAAFESTLGTIAESVPPAMYEFLTARGSEWDAPVVGDRFARPPIPSADVFDLRRDTEAQKHRRQPEPIARMSFPVSSSPIAELDPEEAAGLGSNNWAVAGAHTADGAALVANDMHLAINVPNTWYRASLVIPDGRAPGQRLRITGVSLPGVPGVVVGSNGHVAWGFTNTGGDWSDLIVLDPDPRDDNKYLTPSGPQALQRISDPIAVHGAEPAPFQSEWTIWGPVIRKDTRGRRIVQHWVAHDPARLAADVTAPEQARTVEEALRTAASLGIPAQNFVAGDTTGAIGWTIAGPIPRRVGFDGSLPTSWADGTRRWDGYLTADEQPRIVNPAAGRIWTANAPVAAGCHGAKVPACKGADALNLIGEGGYADGIRARIIRDRLLATDHATPSDMLSVQLDTTALFHDRWRTLLLEKVLTPDALTGHADRAEFRRLVDRTWTGRADPQSVGYLLVRTFRAVLASEVFSALTARVKAYDESFDYARTLRSEGPLWQLVSERPPHLLNPKYPTWDAQLLAAVDRSIADLSVNGAALATRAWSTFNRAIVAHPLGNALPFVARYVNMPDDPLPGDVYTPRAHSPRTGPSERMAVTPGRESAGILHMPGGQSGHPLSSHYADEHRAWVNGDPLPFLPGATVSRLTLMPQ